ncbi:MAG: hypothetical protein NTZ16_13730 [Verrucomicrobia bacterium]|nr:hypothetical protein [Verrucomicrobiota bacterium]
MKSFLKPSVAALLAMSLTLAISANAEKKEKGEGKAKAEASATAKVKALPYAGTLSAKTADSVTVKQKTAEKTFAVTADTKITKDGKPAKLDDAVVGEPVGLSYIDNAGKLEAKSIRLGAKPAKPAGEKKEKAEKKAE